MAVDRHAWDDSRGLPVRLKPTGGWNMAQDEDLPVRKRRRLEPLLLDALGVEELRNYIVELRDEIGRVEADIARKHSHRSAADAFFRPR
jgi:uncharacterized small protein (DUF1192 family)